MGKVVKAVATVAAVAIAFVPGVGTAIGGAVLATIGTSFAAAGAVSAALGVIASIGVMQGLGIVSKAIGLGPKQPDLSPATTDRLIASIDPSTPRKMVLGRTAMATDIRYQEWTDDQSYLHEIVCLASHRITSVDELWLDDKRAWTVAGGVTSEFSGYLSVAVRTEGSASNTIFISSKWSTQRRLTGCAYLYLRFKVTANSKKSESPFVASIPSRMTVIGDGAPVYDPRKDSSVGGSGSQRADNQASWTWDDNAARNPALQLLWYLLGWRINDRLALGRGVPVERIDLDSFMTAANACDETVVLAAGGSEPRYRSDGIFSEADSPAAVMDTLTSAMNGVLRDAGGKLRLDVIVNDLASPMVHLTDDDVLGAFEWQQTPSIDQSFNVVRGRFTNPSPAALYQLTDYPEVRLDAVDGIDRILTMDLAVVQSAAQAQRLAKQALQRAQYPGTFAAEFNARGWIPQIGDPVQLTFSPLGFSAKLFRVVEQTIRADGVTPLVLREENADTYAWDRSERPAVQPADANVYDPRLAPLVRAVSTGAVAPANPPDITGFDAQVIGAQCHLQWDLASASGLSHYVVKFQPVLTGGLWSKAVTLLARVPINAAGATVPAMNGTYFVKAVNVFDFESRNAARVVTNVALLNALNVVATVGEGPEYDGALTDLVRTTDGLMLSGGSNVDLWPDFDAIDNVDQGQVDAAVALEGLYEGVSLLDLGAVYTSRLTATIDADGVDFRSNVDLIQNVDAIDNFDGADPSTWNVALLVKLSDDAMTFGDWRPFTVGDYTARAFLFGARLTSTDFNVSPLLRSFSVQVDMPDRVIDAKNIVCPAGGMDVDFVPPFRVEPAVSVTGQDMATGDYWQITAKSDAGFHIRFFNAGGSGVSRTFDWIAKGYGVQQ